LYRLVNIPQDFWYLVDKRKYKKRNESLISLYMSKIFILSGHSGVGKNTIFRLLERDLSDFFRVVTCTTRKPRPGEVDGKDYFFLTDQEFKDRIAENRFLEYAHVHDWFYGTPLDEIEKAEKLGKNILLTIDVQGATKIKRERPETIIIFLKYAGDNLEQLIRDRIGRESARDLSEDEVKRRIVSAKKEAEYVKYYDFVVENPEGHPEAAVEEIEGIIESKLVS